MRKTIAGLVAGAAMAVTFGGAPAMACQVVNPCGGGLFQSFGSVGYGYQGSYGYQGGYGYVAAERLPDPTGPQYYYVNQGPTYTGPGNLAPAPVYQERAVSGWQGYSRPYYSGYDGGPYGDATNHFYDGAPAVQGPAVYIYRPRRTHYRPYRVGPKYYYAARPAVRYSRPAYAPRVYAQRPMMHGPRVRAHHHYIAPYSYRPGPRVLRYKY